GTRARGPRWTNSAADADPECRSPKNQSRKARPVPGRAFRAPGTARKRAAFCNPFCREACKSHHAGRKARLWDLQGPGLLQRAAAASISRGARISTRRQERQEKTCWPQLRGSLWTRVSAMGFAQFAQGTGLILITGIRIDTRQGRYHSGKMLK